MEVTPAQGGSYHCCYWRRGWEPNVWSHPSDALELLVTGEVLGERVQKGHRWGGGARRDPRRYGEELAQGHTRRVTQRDTERALSGGVLMPPLTRPLSLAESGDISACPDPGSGVVLPCHRLEARDVITPCVQGSPIPRNTHPQTIIQVYPKMSLNGNLPGPVVRFPNIDCQGCRFNPDGGSESP